MPVGAINLPEPISLGTSLTAYACHILGAPDPSEKCKLAQALPARLAAGAGATRDPRAPDRPARPERPPLLDPKHMKRRGTHTLHGRVALLHAVAHIELNAIDLAADMIARFGADPRIGADVRSAFLADWALVAADEARHFGLLSQRLIDLGAAYGDLPAHDGLWKSAQATAHDLLARLAIVPLVLEARGLDVTPSMIVSLEAAGDGASAALLRVILEEEVAHVGAGWRWFEHVCTREGCDAAKTFRGFVARFLPGALKGPFNEPARARAGLLPHLYGAASA